MNLTLSITDAMVEVLTQRVPIICESDLRRYMRRRGIPRGVIKQELQRLKRRGLIRASVVNLPSAFREPFEITQTMDAEAMAVALVGLTRPLSQQVGAPEVVLSAAAELTGLCGKTPVRLADPERLFRFVRLGRAFSRLDKRTVDIDWKTAWPCRKNPNVMARVTTAGVKTIYFVAPPAMKLRQAVAWVEAMLGKEDRYVVC